MRRFFLAAVCAALPFVLASEPTGMVGAPVAFAQEAPKTPDAPKAPDVDIDVNRTERHVISFADPMVLAMIAGGAVLLVLLVAMASRGGGTTIVREK